MFKPTWSKMPSKKKGVLSRRFPAKSSEKKAPNPFEVRVNRRKHDILGQKRKSDTGLPGVSRSKAIQKRKKTLLVEYKQKNKSNKLVDRRFGEGEEELSVEDKMMQRFILQKKRKHDRSSLFNLNDEEEDQLTHFGQSVGEMERFDDVLLSDEDNDMEEEDIGETHFGGFLKRKQHPCHEKDETEAPAKTRKQILDEMVAKFKAQKYERQSEQMEMESLMEKVDSEWKTIHSLFPKVDEGQSSHTADDYDRSVRELQFERRGQALDKMKAEEVVAREEKNKMEASEGLFPVPDSLGVFRKLVEGCGPEECQVLVERVYTCNHPSLSSGNKQRLQDFLGVLVDYFMKVGEESLSADNLSTLDKLVGPLYKLAKLDTNNVFTIFQKALTSRYEEWAQTRNILPSFSTVVLLQLTGRIFSTSDCHHPLTSPALVFMAQVLSQCQVKSVSHLLLGLMLCRTVMEYVSGSSLFVPELVNYLTSCVGHFSKSKHCIFLPPFSARSKLRRRLAETPSGEEELTNSSLPVLLTSCTDSEPHNCDVLKVVLDMNSELLQLYKDVPSFPEVFSPLHTNVSRLELTGWPTALSESVETIKSSYTELSAKPRALLQMLKQKPSSIKFYEPRFDEVYDVDRKKPRAASSQKREQQKLKYKLKKETKGAIREIRKDAAFLANVQLEETLLLDAERQRKTRRLMHELQTQQHEAKKF